MAISGIPAGIIAFPAVAFVVMAPSTIAEAVAFWAPAIVRPCVERLLNRALPDASTPATCVPV